MIPRQAKRDASEPAIIETLEALGYSVLRLSVKDGPDLIAAKAWDWSSANRYKPDVLFIECKTGKAKLKPGQQKFAERWPVKVYLFRTPEDVLEALGGR
jgi:hypothetical protein